MKKFIIPAVVVLILAFGTVTLLKGRPVSAPSKNQDVPAAQGLKFQDQSYAASAYLISDDPISPESRRAMTGFRLEKQPQPDGSVNIMLIAIEPAYRNQAYSLKPGEKLYFIEKFMGDDTGGQERNIMDDTAVIVDSQGFVVQPPTDWSK